MQKQLVFWLVALCIALLFFWYLQDILLPFIAGFVAAYFLDPIADRLVRLGLPRALATAVIIVSAVVAVIVGVLLVLPVFGTQIGKLVADAPNLSRQFMQIADQSAPQWLKDFFANNGSDLQSTLTDYAGKAALWFVGFLTTLWNGSKALLNLASLSVITPVVAFYMLNDWDRLVAKVDGWLPREHIKDLRSIAHDVDTALAGYIRGQGTVCLILAVFYAAGFMLMGLKSGLAIGIMTGLLAFIPFFGPLIGGAIAIIVGLVQFWPNEISVLSIVAILAIGQLVESYFLSPKLVGESIGLHPVWMMLALLAFSYVFGILGLLLAVPLAATTGVFVRHGLARYLASEIYLGGPKKNAKRA
ncbi:AI-2E family transporter [Aestuariivirga litoralis]|uniref:AI-2E family transporter n=1 Tax=Aestuariivirga litoralis TaxID=2650924 RepID=UPI0018C480B1|nr:AI-2E family transporter [Aestuariivirga litoralis]MBG1231232.1 AI-2E family transporter [Aestuariivirga litoralis]